MRCQHEWEPLVKIETAGLTKDKATGIWFALQLQRLEGYDRCKLCGRISYIRNSRARGRSLLSCDTAHIEQRAREFEAWVTKYRSEAS